MVLRPPATGQAGAVPPSDGDLTTPRGLTLPAAAIDERFARGSGPGGQHRNVTASAVELVADLNALDGPGADRVRAVLGELVRVKADDSRSQWRNRSIARERLAELIDQAAVPVPPRRPTRPSRRARQRRLDDKGRASARKRDRSWRPGDE
jgi:ribosome-associated protein